jgi:hypothetical protein
MLCNKTVSMIRGCRRSGKCLPHMLAGGKEGRGGMLPCVGES